MGRAAGSQGIEWHRLRPPVEGVVVLGEWRRCSAELGIRRKKRREIERGFGWLLAVGGVSRVEQSRAEEREVRTEGIREQRREDGVRRKRVVGVPFMDDGFRILPALFLRRPSMTMDHG
jgi:hypothetical protein